MAITFAPSSRASAAAGFLQTLSQATLPSNSRGFEQQLLTAISDSMLRAGFVPGQFQVNLTPPGEASALATRQIVVTFTGQPQQAEREGGTPPASSTQGDESSQSPIEVLKAALSKAGLDPGKFKFTELREVVGYPGGCYENHHIQVEVANGVSQCYDVRLMLDHPEVTVCEIRRLIGTSGIQAV